MTILQINKYQYLKGGTERVLFNTVDLLRERQHRVLLFATDEGVQRYEDTFTTPALTFKGSLLKKSANAFAFFYNRGAARNLKKVLKTEKIDIAHIHLWHNSMSASILRQLKKHAIPMVATLHDYREICPSYLLLDRKGQVCQKCRRGRYWHCATSRCSKGSPVRSAALCKEMYFNRLFFKAEKYISRFICVSPFQQQIVSRFKPAIALRSQVIANPVLLSAPQKVEKGSYLVFFGRLSREKGLPLLLNVMAALPDVRLVVAGAAPDTSQPSLPNVDYAGFLDGEALNELVAKAMFTVVPSQWYETFGLACIESQRLATPAIVSDMGALPQLVEDGISGFVFENLNPESLKNAIEKALALTDEQYSRMCQRAQENSMRYTGENYISQLLALYGEVIENN